MPELATEAVLSLLSRARFRWVVEKDLQDGIEELFRKAQIPFQREHRMGEAGIIDFLVDGTCGVEVKIAGQRRAVLAQLERYAEVPEVVDLVLVTGRTQLKNMPRRVKGKPLYVSTLKASLF